MTLLDPQKWLIRSDTTMETAAVIERAMCELPPEQREVVVMKVWAEMTLEEIATVVELPLNTVASRYRYALSRMRQILKRD
jgi:RNA polymerase sigma-70 factor (ECF subfamily)